MDSEIPLFALYELMTHDVDNWDFTEEEYEAALVRTRIACVDFYFFHGEG